MRQEGFYWVKYCTDDMVGHYKHNGIEYVWRLPGINSAFDDSDLDSINESPIDYEVNSKWIPPTLLIGGQRVAFMNEESLKEFMKLANLQTVAFEPEAPKGYTLIGK